MKAVLTGLLVGGLFFGAVCYQNGTDPRPEVHQIVQEVRQGVSGDR